MAKKSNGKVSTRSCTGIKTKEQSILRYMKESEGNEDLSEKMSRMEKKLESLINILERREEEWREEKQRWVEEKKVLEERINRLEWEKERGERRKRRNNIVIKGANIEKENIEKKVEDFIEGKIKVRVKV